MCIVFYRVVCFGKCVRSLHTKITSISKYLLSIIPDIITKIGNNSESNNNIKKR